MRIIIPGGTGQVGTVLARYLCRTGHEVVILSRRPVATAGLDTSGGLCRWLHWDGATLGAWTQEFDGADAVINLAGRSVNCRYHARHRREIMDSRVNSVRAVAQAIATCRAHPACGCK